MKKRPSLLLVLMLVSLPISAAGLALYYWSYEKKAAVEAALEQLEFVRMMPHVITNGEKIRLPAFTHNSIMASNKRFSGSLSCDYFEGNISLRRLKAEIFFGPFRLTSLECLVDARTRN